ncbi:MAG: sigma-70 family RNA polymerase sigma factor [Hamadaea sp.]|nr:sigma-70 family RNA polymerase sigma factor [Hamadaea sp.]
MDFVEFYRATSPRTLRYAYGLTGDLPQAQDVVQEAYARAWQRWRKVSGYDDAEAWLRLVVTRLVFDWWRHLAVRRKASAARVGVVPPPSEDTVLLTTALRQLPEPQRRALALHYLLDLPVGQIAAETGVPEGTVKSWLSRGRAGLAEALREESDAAKIPPVEEVTARARRRTRTQVAAAAGLAVLAILVLATVILRDSTPDPTPPQPVAPTTSPVAFRKLEQVGDVAVAMPSGVEFGMADVVGDRGFVAWRGPTGQLGLGAVDVRTGKALWPVRTLPGTFGDWNGMIALPNAIVSIGEHDDGTSPDKEMFVVDPATGKLRWHRGMDVNGFDILAYPDVLVLADHDGKKTTAFDWVTGRPVWSIEGAITATFGMHTAHDLTSPAGYRAGPFATLESGSTLLQVDGAGTLTEYAVATGKPTGRSWPGAAPGSERGAFVAYEGRVYTVADSALRVLRLEAGQQWQAVYSAEVPVASPDNGNRLNNLTPCGRGLICVVDGDLFQADVVALDGIKVVWRTRVAGVETMLPAGEYVYVSGSSEKGPHSVLLDGHGKDVLTEAERAGTLTRVDGNAMFLYHDGHLFGLDLGTRRRTDLGAFEQTGLGPGIGSKVLITQSSGGFVLYRYAA